MATAIVTSKRGATEKSPRFRLTLTKLNFISPVDMPAQENATARLLKRAGDGFHLASVARVAKVSDELGLVFAWAWTSKVAGEDHFDLHGDAIDDGDDMVKVAADFMSGARLTDEMHDREADGQVVFGMPMTPEIAKAFGIETDTSGFMVALRPSAEVFAKFKSGEYTGISIDGMGIREKVATAASAMKRAALTDDAEGHSHLFDLDVQSGTTSGGYFRPDGGHDSYHYHPYVIADGAVEIGMSAGHTHAPRAAAAKAAHVVVQNSISPGAFVAALDPHRTEKAMTTDADKIKQLEADLVKANTEIAKFKAPPAEVVYKAADGTLYTAADDERLVKMARANDAQAAELADERIAKRAVELCKHLGGTVDVKKAVVKAFDSIADQATRAAAYALLAGADAAMKAAQLPIGTSPTTAPEGSARAAFFKMADEYAVTKGVDRGRAITKLTRPGPDFSQAAADLYEEMQSEPSPN